jgi:uncharacterized protein (TIGR03083 family)
VSFLWDDSRAAFGAATEWFVRSVALVGTRWAEPGLGEWDVRALVGHASRSLLTVEEYLARPAATVEVVSTADYYRAIRGKTTGPAVAQRGRDAGTALGDDPASAVTELAARVLPLVAACTGDELPTTIAGGMRLADYLPTRTFELVVHTCDLARALDLPMDVPPPAAAQALALVSELAIADGTAGTLLLAATGRSGLPPDFSVL